MVSADVPGFAIILIMGKKTQVSIFDFIGGNAQHEMSDFVVTLAHAPIDTILTKSTELEGSLYRRHLRSSTTAHNFHPERRLIMMMVTLCWLHVHSMLTNPLLTLCMHKHRTRRS